MKAKQDPIIENVFSKHDSEIIKTAFKHRGFISGGCAILLKRYNDLALDSEKESIDGYHRWKSVFDVNYWISQDYVNSSELSLRLSHLVNNMGDIDIWFPTKQDYDSFISDIKEIEQQDNKKIFMFESKYAMNISVVEIEKLEKNDSSIKIFTQCKIQAINKDFGSMEVIMNNFDLLNSMIAFDGELFTYVDSWKEIDDRREIIVNKLNSETLKRILKYSTKKDFSKLSEGASKLVKDELLNTIHWIDQVGVNVTKKSEIDLDGLSVFQLQMLWRIVKDPYDDIVCDAGNSFGVHAVAIKDERPQVEQKAKVVNELLENTKNIIKKLSTSDILELSAYQCDQLSEDDEDTSTRGYNFMKHALIKKLQERMRES